MDVNTLPTFLIEPRFIQMPPVWSRKFRIWAHMLPNRAGVPKMIASQVVSSATFTICAAGSTLAPANLATSSGIRSGTRLRRLQCLRRHEPLLPRRWPESRYAPACCSKEQALCPVAFPCGLGRLLIAELTRPKALSRRRRDLSSPVRSASVPARG